MTPEGRVKDKCKTKLKQMGAWYFMPVSNGMGKHGIPDIIVCLPVRITQDMVGMRLGLFAAVETKAPGKLKNVTPLQIREINAIKEAGGFAEVVEDSEKMGSLWPPVDRR